MPPTQKQISKNVQKLVDSAAKNYNGKAPATHRKFLDIMSSDIVETDVHLFDDHTLNEMADVHCHLAETRKFGEPKIRIYSPTTKNENHRRTFIDIVGDDFAFLVDSVIAEINRHNLLIDLLLHPTVFASYDENGKFEDVTLDRKRNLLRQAHIHIQIKDVLQPKALKDLKDGLYIALQDVYYANRDWTDMLDLLKDAREDLANAHTKRSLREIERYCAFLDYLADNNFTLLGYREYEFVDSKDGIVSKTLKGQSLGLLADDVSPAYLREDEEGLPRNLQELRRNLPPVSISKTNRISTVHRRVPMDAIAIKTYDEKGHVTGERLFLGLFTSVTYSRSVGSVPYLREKVEDVLEISGFLRDSHDGKALRHILEKYPRDELFQIEPEELYKTAVDILRLQERQRIALFMRQDPFGRYISCLVYIPRDRFGSELRATMVSILEEELNGECSNFYTTLDDSVFARVMIVIRTSQKKTPKFNDSKIEARLQKAGQTWSEMLNEALNDNIEEQEQVIPLLSRYGEAFPIGYTSRYSAKQAIFDIEKIQCVIAAAEMNLDLYRPENLDGNKMRLKIYNPENPITLSDVLPILENMGLRSIAELPFEVKPQDCAHSVWIHDFLLESPSHVDAVCIADIKKNFERAFTKIWHGEMENDGLNRLTLRANTNWHEITILRTYVRYLKQIQFPFSRPYLEKALTENPKISRMLVDLFKTLHDPAAKGDREQKAKTMREQIREALKDVDSLDQDRTIRMIAKLMFATVRTNYFQRTDNDNAKNYLAMKISSRQIEEIPDPKPFMEIFVYAPDFEAIHLRGDKIARGGLRWSDRREDFRMEVLGLMKAQMVKNSVIVPTGSKGGFVLKTNPVGREAFHKEGVRCYKIFIQALLDITDNLKGNDVIPPKNVVRRDEDDPYLVVAADKGTASFSDIANGISLENNFWLGDAFASGGSAGYDHKKMAITARGAWESVKAHFRQLNHNTQEQPFDVVGVGDMGGDVFGNGMLLSEHIRLIGAFNHMHIFCDPDPNPETSFKERKRLFKGVKGWDEYNESYLSQGGRIFDRSEKSLELTPEIQARFDIHKDKVSPNELMNAMLKARTDLLWFGGIGTYIKSEKETHREASDKANDPIRVDASEIRAKVIGEGANLGVTQRGRIEFAENGGKINTDFIDNSAGVDSSDHEVNIKILLADVMEQKKHKMDLKGRNKLLEKMTEQVAALVLRNNYQQAQAISLADLQAKENLEIQEDFIQDLERKNILKRKIEDLPDEETIETRRRNGKGLTRPELSILLSYAKMTFTDDLLASDLPDNTEVTEEWIVGYFPKEIQNNYRKEIFRHRLARQIIATTMANSLVNRMGPTFIKSRMDKTGADPADIAKAYVIVRDAFGLRPLWDSIEALDNKVPAEVQMKAMREVALLAQHAITWFLTRPGRQPAMKRDIENFGEGVKKLRKHLDSLVHKDLCVSIEQRCQANIQNGMPKELAHEIAIMPILTSACDIIRIALEQKTDLLEAARAYFAIGAHFNMDWLRQQTRYLNTEGYWQNEVANGLMEQLYRGQAGLATRILKDTARMKKNNKSAKDADTLELWIAQNTREAAKLDPLFEDLRRAGSIDLTMLVMAEQRLRNLYGG